MIHEKYMYRCLQLAVLGTEASPNPRVGAVLVYNDMIIGEGYHEKYGEAHAEVNCINSVADENKKYIHKSTLYVSLEPCAHFGKTPPCTNLIIENKIPIVVIGCRDNFSEVNGRGIEKLQQAGITVIEGVLQKQSIDLNKPFFTFNQYKRPYIILKWAQSGDRKIANADFSPVKISNEFTDILVHKWRSECAAIVVGKRTVLHDNPALTNRYWKGKSPIRIIIDKDLSLPNNLQLFDNRYPTVVFNYKKNATEGKVQYQLVENKHDILLSMMDYLFANNIQSILVEGGTATLQSFINAGLWDEARIITNKNCIIDNGINAPELKNFSLMKEEKIYTDDIQYFINKQNNF